MRKVLGCVQSSYLPWPGYFHIIERSDVFVFHDDIQYTKQDWRNRNRIKSQGGVKWLTVPVCKETTKGNVEDVTICNDKGWRQRHWRMIEGAYQHAPYFRTYGDILRETYERQWQRLSDLNIHLITRLCDVFGIQTAFLRSSDLGIVGRKTDRLIQLCEKLCVSHYVSGPSAAAYIEPEKFHDLGIALEYMRYEYPAYPQLYQDFVPRMSAIDLLFNCGPHSSKYVWKTERRTEGTSSRPETASGTL